MILKIAIQAIVAIILCTTKANGQTHTFPIRSQIKVDIKEMLPEQYPAKKLSTGYFFQLHNDTVYLHLPYSGRVYRYAYASDGLNFKSIIQKAASKKQKDGTVLLSFRMQNQTVDYRCRVEIASDSSVVVFLKPDNAQSISYEGTLSKN